ncbi:MAG: DUF4351 domain-containing protein [Acidobacteria bacterium]|nr:DUF4351 domain-containing protein [Acidobacteriota bacterium]
MKQPKKPAQEKDNAWKDVLNQFFREFMEFFFPAIASEIDWTRGYEFLDKELEQITRDHRIGRKLADKLVKVWLRDGREQWLLIHLEVQGAIRQDFAKRVYIYNYRIFDRYDAAVISIVLLTDGSAALKQLTWQAGRWGCELMFRFPVVSIAGYKSRWAELEAAHNPFAIAVMAHLRAKQARGDNLRKLDWKRELIFRLYERGYSHLEIYTFFRFVDWVMILPKELEQKLKTELHQYEENKHMPYISSWERFAMEEGRQQGLEQGLEQGLGQGLEQGTRNIILRQLDRLLGDIGTENKTRVAELSLPQLDKLSEALLDFTETKQLTSWLNRHTRRKRK